MNKTIVNISKEHKLQLEENEELIILLSINPTRLKIIDSFLNKSVELEILKEHKWAKFGYASKFE